MKVKDGTPNPPTLFTFEPYYITINISASELFDVPILED